MNARRLIAPAAGLLTLAFPAAFGADAPKASASDLTTPDKRAVSVELTRRLAKPPVVAPLPEPLPQPFSPPGFDQTDAEERAAAMAAATKSAQGSQGPKITTDRDTLEAVAARLTPTGTIFAAEEPRILVFGKKPVRVGTHFTVTYNGQDYDLELVNIDRTTFTLRLNQEEITRPITPGKSK